VSRFCAGTKRLRYTCGGITLVMIRTSRTPIASSCFCLLAVILLYAPLGAALWTAQSMPCCTGDHCPIPSHHHQKTPPAPAQHMNCGHEMTGMTACSISCCQTTDRPMVVSLAFVLPHLSFSFAPPLTAPLAKMQQAAAFSSFFAPLSPPPRFLTAVL
jgi:hypothetical protein